MFSSLDFETSALTMHAVKTWAADACTRYVADGVHPTSSLVKLAQDNSLTPHQTAVLAGEINKSIHAVKYASMGEDKYHAADFPLADSKKALEQLQTYTEEDLHKMSPALESKYASDYVFIGEELPDPVLPRDFRSEPYKEAESLDSRLKPIEKVASLQYRTAACHQKLAHAVQEQKDAAIMAELQKSSAESAFFKVARQYILEALTPQERVTKLAEVEHAIKCANLTEASRKPMAKLAFTLCSEGILNPSKKEALFDYFMNKTADEKAPQELISKYLQARVVNGSHPLVVTLKTYADACEREKMEKERSNFADDKLRIYEQKITSL